jgi:hypothetical protein
MEGSVTTIREMFMKHLGNKCNALFHSMEHTNTYDVYRLLFDETNMEQVDTLLATIDYRKAHSLVPPLCCTAKSRFNP